MKCKQNVIHSINNAAVLLFRTDHKSSPGLGLSPILIFLRQVPWLDSVCHGWILTWENTPGDSPHHS